MTTQQQFDFTPRTLARRTDPATSKAAAREVVRSRRLSYQCDQALSAVKKWPGNTTAELAGTLTMCGPGDMDFGEWKHMLSRRLSDLEKRGLIRKGPARQCRVGERQATTWEIVQ